jgi:hypothetical protein
MDLFVVPTFSFRLLYGLVILNHRRRQILWLGVTAHPTAEWMARQLTEACGWDGTPEYLVRDRDAVYGAIFIRRLRAMGIRDRPIAPRSPWQNGHAERLIGSLRRECLDHVIVLGERHLRQLLLLYKDYYNRARTHLSLNKDAPVPRDRSCLPRSQMVTRLGKRRIGLEECRFDKKNVSVFGQANDLFDIRIREGAIDNVANLTARGDFHDLLFASRSARRGLRTVAVGRE